MDFFIKPSETVYMEKVFWDNVFVALIKKKMSQRELAELSGVSRTVINNGIGHHHRPHINHAFKIARALGTSVEFLMTGRRELGLSADESEALEVYRAIPERGKGYALRLLKIALENELQREAEVKAQVDTAASNAL